MSVVHLKQFRLRERWSDRPGSIVEGALPKGLPGRLVKRYLDRHGLVVGRRCPAREVERYQVSDIALNAGELLEAVEDQLRWARYTGYTPTKVIVGPDANQILAADWSEDSFYRVELPANIPYLMGMELVINPCISGVALG